MLKNKITLIVVTFISLLALGFSGVSTGVLKRNNSTNTISPVTNNDNLDIGTGELTSAVLNGGVNTSDSQTVAVGTGDDLQLSVSSDDAIIQNATADKDIIFHVNDSDGGGVGQEVMRIDGSTQYVGIGKTTPGTILDVSEENDGGETALRITNSAESGSTDETVSIIFNHWTQGGSRIECGRDNDYSVTGNQDSYLTFYNFLDGNSVEYLRIDSTGNIGISESSPATLLELTDTAPYITLHNDTEEDTDGGRESKIIFKGEQSGSEETTLATIQASHDGTSDDEKGDLIFSVNDGNDGDTPTEAMRIDSNANIGIGTSSLESWDPQYTVVEIGGTSSVMGVTAEAAGGNLLYNQNAKWNAGWTYVVEDEASTYKQSDGEHNFRVAASGAADSAITWTEAFIIKSNGAIQYTPTSDQTIVAGTGLTSDMLRRIIRVVGNSGNIDITANPQIADGVDGQIIMIQGTHDTDTVQFDDGTGLALAGGVSFTVGQGDILQLVYDSGDDIWYEISRSDN